MSAPDLPSSDRAPFAEKSHTGSSHADSNRLHLQLMGIVNVTPDSFSDGRRYLDLGRATTHIHHLLDEDVDIIDIGGESTRPGAHRIDAEEECRRVLPIIDWVAANTSARLSIDTMRADVAECAVERGASMINDVSGGFADSRMHSVVAASGVQFVIGHWRRYLPRTSTRTVFDVRAVIEELKATVEHSLRSGVGAEQLFVDPGIGFGKDPELNWQILEQLPLLADSLGLPVVIGASRKSFLREVSNRPAAHRDSATTALHTLVASRGGASIIRTHDVAAARDALAVQRKWDDLSRGRSSALRVGRHF
ncbi:dihydropteroate synthase [Rhodococcus sp. 14-2483-1-2]|uniref:dihydropteroate synthase n=1 Tax=Rhodococcus sp. 14-2483-1-2 TaxID=2023147 RepID=UPI000B9C2546|nr:dihydropteroate synthase [Rhodococcus sp. 14-2483-1-2]OZF26063.1 dihydropteroate synthase [Rhodococcus sp. 14-2483-1-2]